MPRVFLSGKWFPPSVFSRKHKFHTLITFSQMNIAIVVFPVAFAEHPGFSADRIHHAERIDPYGSVPIQPRCPESRWVGILPHQENPMDPLIPDLLRMLSAHLAPSGHADNKVHETFISRHRNRHRKSFKCQKQSERRGALFLFLLLLCATKGSVPYGPKLLAVASAETTPPRFARLLHYVIL